jgi:DNA-binding NarL/FixJ family response regulator
VTGPDPPALRVLVVDDDALVRSALVMMLDGANGIRVVGEATDGEEVPTAVAQWAPEVVLMDIRMPRVDGITATAALRRRPSAPEVIVLTTFDADELVLGALRAGAAGFLLKDARPSQIVEAIRQVAAGDPILAPRVIRRLIEHVAGDDRARSAARQAMDTLSEREREVVLAVGRGGRNADIAGELHMSVATVKAHISHIFAKLGLANRTQIAMLAHDAGLI